MSKHRLRVGDLILSDGQNDDPNLGAYRFSVYGDGLDGGEPVPVEREISSALRDGARVFTESYGNREYTFTIVIEGPDSVALSLGEQALARWVGIRTELGMIPFDGMAPETVLDVETSSFRHVHDDLIEVLRSERVYVVRFVCQPFVRPNRQTVVSAVPIPSGVTPTTTVIDDGSITTRWSARIGTLTDQGSFLRISGSQSPRAVYTPAAPVSLVDRHYVSIDYDYDFLENKAGQPLPYLLTSAGYAPVVASTTGSGLPRRLTWMVAADSVSSMEFGLNLKVTRRFDFNNLTVSNVPPFYGSTKQTPRTLMVRGSARSQGSVAISAPDGQILGSTLFYSTTDLRAGNPALRGRRVSGGTPVVDAAAITGIREPFTAPIVFEVPVSQMAPGKHQLVASMHASTFGTYTVTWTTQTRVNNSDAGPAETGTASVTFSTAGYQVLVLGNTNLPPASLPANSNGLVRITISAASSALSLDEVWPFNLDTGALSWATVPMRRCWFETPTIERPYPAFYIGSNADQSDAYTPDGGLLRSWGESDHVFAGLTGCYIIASMTDAAQAEYTYFERYWNFVPIDPPS